MTCTSGSVQTVADNTVKAKQQIDKLQDMIKAQESANKQTFYDNIKQHLTDAKVKDGRELSYASDIKTEYTSEFSLDKIAAVVTAALKAVAAAQDPLAKAPALSPAAIAAYVDVVNTVAEAAKAKASAAASLSFSMSRMSPGLFAFLSASTVNITDVDTFGTEAVTTTAIYYRFMQSINDVQNQAAFGAAVIDAKNLLDMKELQAGLTKLLELGNITIDDWTKKDEAYSKAVERIQARLDADKFPTNNALVLTVEFGFGGPINHSFATGSRESQEIVRASIKKLSAMGLAYSEAVKVSKARLESNYY